MPPLVPSTHDRSDTASAASPVVNVAQKEMKILVGVDVPVPAYEVRKGLERLARLLVIELNGRDEEICLSERGSS